MDNGTAVEVALSRLRQLGVTLTPAGDRIRCRPASIVPSELLDILKQHKGELLHLLAAEAGDGVVQTTAADLGGVPVLVPADLLGMPLDVFAREGQPLEVRVPWAPVTLWFCPDARHAEILVSNGVSRGRIWTAAELMDLLSPADLAPEAARVFALAKLEFDGDVVAVGRRDGSTVRPNRRGNGGSP